MSAFTLDLEVNQGSSYSKLVTWKTGVPATPVDLTGCTAFMQVRSRAAALAVILEFTTSNGGIILGGTAGTIRLAILSAEATTALDCADAVYDLEIVFADGTRQRKIEGSFTISPEVTRV